MILAGTGHRPEKLGGYNNPVVEDRLRSLAIAALQEREPEKVITGMALGWDQILAEAARACGIPYIAAVPFEGQEKRWPSASQVYYRALLKDAAEVVYVCLPGYAAWKMQARNKWMVSRADRMLALWDGSPGGTGNCCNIARIRKVPIDNLWARWEEIR